PTQGVRVQTPSCTVWRRSEGAARWGAAAGRWPRAARQTRPKSESMPPLRFKADTVAPAPEGSESLIGPFTELSEIGWQRLIRLKPASSWPLMVDRSACPSSFSARMLPFTLDALMGPVTPLM